MKVSALGLEEGSLSKIVDLDETSRNTGASFTASAGRTRNYFQYNHLLTINTQKEGIG